MTQGIVIQQTRRDEVVVEVSRPPDNSFTVEMCDTLSDLLGQPPQGAHVLRLRAEGEAFCLGRERSATDRPSAQRTVEALVRVTRGLAESTLVTIAEVGGDVAGFGVGLVAHCDVAVASDGARFWFPEVEHDLAPALVLSWLPRVIGQRQAFWLTASAARLSADEAQQLGLVNFVVPAGQLAAKTDEVVAELVRYPSQVHAQIKSNLRDFGELTQAVAYRAALDRLILSAVTGPPIPD
ncbi:MAG: enoyl-CoA hydratase/isomerase family protein [Candidatus Dormibacteria bacterium]